MVDHALIVGAGTGISAAFARALVGDGTKVALAARDVNKLTDFAKEIGAETFVCDASDPKSVSELFAKVNKTFPKLDVVLYNPGARISSPLVDLEPEKVRDAITLTAFGAFLVAQQAARRMLEQGHGTIFFTGASAGVKGYPESATFAMGKFALRGLTESMARELHPQNIHIAHFVIDGGVAGVASGRPVLSGRSNTPENPDKWLEPDAIAQTYMAILKQPRSAWTSEIILRPWQENY